MTRRDNEPRGSARAAELILATLEHGHISERQSYKGCMRAAEEIRYRNGWVPPLASRKGSRLRKRSRWITVRVSPRVRVTYWSRDKRKPTKVAIGFGKKRKSLGE